MYNLYNLTKEADAIVFWRIGLSWKSYRVLILGSNIVLDNSKTYS